MTTALVAFTRDLRVRDNPALAAARAHDRCVPLFVFDDAVLATSHGRPNRLGFLLESLRDLDAALRERRSALVIRRGNWCEQVIDVARRANASEIHLARDVSGYAQRRRARLGLLAGDAGIDVVVHDAVTVVPPGEVRPAGGGPFLVFTPYYRRWLAQPWRAPAPTPRSLPSHDIEPGTLPELSTFTREPRAKSVVVGGERNGLAMLRSWSTRSLDTYGDDGHDDLSGDRTSHLSAYLHFGCVSALEVATRLRDRPGGAAFVRQLCWRDFYSQLLAARPEVARDDVRDASPAWNDDAAGIAAWKAGRTGYPLVDAGMRQLARDGWMHNRARMVVASFLTKDLLVDWRIGAAHFMDHLVDGDVALNQLNWQWVAGTGTDSNPHRVYNPTVQSRKFDPDGAYIRRYVEELAQFDGDIHDPGPLERAALGYPAPIVDHKVAIENYRAARRDTGAPRRAPRRR